MTPIDIKASADAHAVATSAFLMALVDQFLAKGLIDRADIATAGRAAMQGLGPRVQTTPEGFDASQILQGLVRQFAKP